MEPALFVSEGEVLPSSSEGADSPVPSELPACEGEDLCVLEFINLETVGLHCLARDWKKWARAFEIDHT